MRKEEQLLVNICSAYLHNEKINIDEDIDTSYFLKLAKHHNLLAVCHCVLHDCDSVSGELKSSLKESFLDYVFTSQCQENTLLELKEIMTEANIPYVLFKGAVLREAYPVKESRAMGDIDLLIKKESRADVRRLLEENGFTCTADNGPVHNYSRGNVLLEVHTKIINEFDESAFSDAFDNAEFDGVTGQLTPDYHMAYLLAHMAHHFKFYGAGIKLVLDLAVMQTAYNIDINNVMALLEPIGLVKFARAMLTICSKWFNVGQGFEADTAAAEEFLVSGGAFGSLRDNKGAVLKRRELEKGKDSGKFITLLRLAFPGYEAVKDIPYIKFISGRPWLLPFAWIYRFFYNIRHRRKFMLDSLGTIGDEETDALAKKELKLLREVGLND